MSRREVEMDTDIATRLNVREWPGYTGAFTRDQAPGAFPNGSRIVKRHRERGDRQPIGAFGVVLGSMENPGVGFRVAPTYRPVRFCYFVEWDTLPGLAVGVVDWKIALIEQGTT